MVERILITRRSDAVDRSSVIRAPPDLMTRIPTAGDVGALGCRSDISLEAVTATSILNAAQHRVDDCAHRRRCGNAIGIVGWNTGSAEGTGPASGEHVATGQPPAIGAFVVAHPACEVVFRSARRSDAAAKRVCG
jgi:hypothetical protein